MNPEELYKKIRQAAVNPYNGLPEFISRDDVIAVIQYAEEKLKKTEQRYALAIDDVECDAAKDMRAVLSAASEIDNSEKMSPSARMELILQKAEEKSKNPEV